MENNPPPSSDKMNLYPVTPNVPPGQPMPYPNQNNYPQQPIPYSQPIIQGTAYPNAVIVNQPVIISGTNQFFSSSPISTTCQFCKASVTTSVEKSFNILACLLCLFTGFLIFACIQCCSGKDILCCDATHKCPNCGNMVGRYVAI